MSKSRCDVFANPEVFGGLTKEYSFINLRTVGPPGLTNILPGVAGEPPLRDSPRAYQSSLRCIQKGLPRSKYSRTLLYKENVRTAVKRPG